ncbi:MAG: DUF3422 domain-containing protein [Rubrivivax sp.]|nr:DUF3422 domain-containing protein [Rubrivivax sp.]
MPVAAADTQGAAPTLPPDDPLRRALHDEVHSRPAARVRLPACVRYVAVLNDGVSRADEARHLATLPDAMPAGAGAMTEPYLRVRLPGAMLRREHHSEFTRYTLVTSQPATAGRGQAVPPRWWAGIPGRLFAAIELTLEEGDLSDLPAVLGELRQGFGGDEVVASLLGDGYALAVTDFRVAADGVERIVVRCAPGTSATRAGRIVQRLLELETYRLMALRGLPASKALAGPLGVAEADLVAITAQTVDQHSADADLLARLTLLAARIEQATAANGYRFSATAAYHAIVQQRIAELCERAVPGTQALGVFMQRRLTPAMATVASTAQRLAALSQRIERAGALLRTRVDIATEAQNQQLLEKLTRGQDLQLRLQSTVEGLSIAAISYYVVSLVLYGAKAAKAAGLPLEPELLAGAAIPLVLWGVWHTVRNIHRALRAGG